jgi:hypothetical protein
VGMLAILFASNQKLRNVSRLLTAEETDGKEEEVQLPV